MYISISSIYGKIKYHFDFYELMHPYSLQCVHRQDFSPVPAEAVSGLSWSCPAPTLCWVAGDEMGTGVGQSPSTLCQGQSSRL